MIAGFNNTGRIWRFTADKNNDDQGGAVPTGTVLYNPVFARIASSKPTQVLLEQGLETPEIFTGYLSYVSYSPTGTFDVQHNDQYEVMYPPVSPFYQKRFVIIGVQHVSYNDPRRFLRVSMRRIETANSDLLLNSVNQLNFDGVDDNITIPASSSINNLPLGDFTAEFSLFDLVTANTPDLLAKHENVNYAGLEIFGDEPTPGNPVVSCSIGGAVSSFSFAEAPVVLSTLRHIAVVYRFSTKLCRIYINGVDLTSTSNSGGNMSDYNDSIFDLLVGGKYPTYFTNMKLRWMRISNVARYTANFTPPSLTLCPPSDMYTRLRMALDERTGTIAHDSSGNANNGLIVGARWQVTE